MPFEQDKDKWSPLKALGPELRVNVQVDHVRGTSNAYYYIEAFDTKIMMRITLNSYRFIVLYFAHSPEGTRDEDFRNALNIVLSGAENVGFDTRLTQNPARWDSETILHEAYFFKEVSKDFLFNSTERLFWSQDIATMTRSVMLQLKRNGWLD